MLGGLDRLCMATVHWWCAHVCSAVVLQHFHAAGLLQLLQGRSASLRQTLALPSDACTVIPMISARSTPRCVQSTVHWLGSGFLCQVLRMQTTTHLRQLVLCLPGFD